MIAPAERGVSLEERKHRRKCFILDSAFATLFEHFAADLKNKSARWRLQGTAVLPSFWKVRAALGASLFNCGTCGLNPAQLRSDLPTEKEPEADAGDTGNHTNPTVHQCKALCGKNKRQADDAA